MYSHKGITYRSATLDDVVGLTLFFENIAKENELLDTAPPDIPRIAETIREVIKENRGVAILALNKDDIIVGAIVLGYITLWWSESGFFNNAAFYVAPAWRRRYNIQMKLLEVSKDFADSTNTPLLIDIFDLKEGRSAKLARFLSFKGFKNIGFKTLYLPIKKE
jgi:hypothetical protein